MNIKVPISVGELYDKISILEIKKEKIRDQDKLVNINGEFDSLSQISRLCPIDSKLYSALKSVNQELWDIENTKRQKELEKDFGSEFIELARNVYIKNDERFKIKNEINIRYDSAITEEKSYF